MPLGLVERTKQSKLKDNISKDKVSKDNISPEQGSDLYKETEITKTFKHDEFLEEVLRQKQSPKSQGKRIAIIGEPGAGKTTFLQHIADWVSCEIKQAIVIWVSLADLQGQTLEEYLYTTWLNAVARKTGKPSSTEQHKNDFATQFQQGRMWLLLDGLDEMSVSSGNPVTEIARQIGKGGSVSQARIVLTCRVNLWDGSRNELDDFDIYRTLDFSYPDQVETFVERWFSNIPKEGRERGKRLCTALKETGNNRIQDFVKNPLRLTLLCLNWQSKEGRLPDIQAELYQQFVDDFYEWERPEFATKRHQRQQLNANLGELAKAAIDEESIRFRLPLDFVSPYLGNINDKNSLLELALNHGWLNCIGIDTNRKPVYAFFHTSFQEYFAAIAINDCSFFLKDIPWYPSKGKYRIFEPQWKQTILFWLGRQEENLKRQKQWFIDALVNFKDGFGAWNKYYNRGLYEYRAYLLAAAGIVEFRGYSKADKIAAQIVKWVVGDAHLIKEEAKSVMQYMDRTKIIAAFVQLLQSSHLDDYTCIQVASSLGQIDPGNKIAIAALVQLLPSSGVYTDYARYGEIAQSLGQIGTGNEIAITVLVEMLLSTNRYHFGYYDYEFRRKAAESLGQIGTGNENAIAALVQLLLSPELEWYNYTFRQAVESLKKIVVGNEILIADLVSTFHYYCDTRRLAGEILKKIATNNEMAITASVQWLQSNDFSWQSREWAAYILGKIGTGNKIAIDALVQFLQSINMDRCEYYIIICAAYSLGKIDPGNEIAIATLVQLLQSIDVDERFWRRKSSSFWKIKIEIKKRIVYRLGEIGAGNRNVIAILMQLLQSTDVDDYIRIEAADSLWKIDPGNENVIAILMQLLQSTDVDDYIRIKAADSLWKINPGNENVIAAVQVLQLTNLGTDSLVEAAYILEEIDPSNEIAIPVLVQKLLSLDDDLSAYQGCARESIAECLIKIDHGNENVLAALIQLTRSTDRDYHIRKWVEKNLGKIRTGNENAIAVLLKLLLQSADLNKRSRIWATYILVEIGTDNEIAIATLMQLLRSTHVDDYIRINAAYSLGKIDSGNEIAISALLQLLLSIDIDDEIREMAAYSLQAIGTGNENAIAALSQLLLSTNRDYLTRNLVAQCLGKIGTGNKIAINALAQLLLSNDEDKYTLRPAKMSESIIFGSEEDIRWQIQQKYRIEQYCDGTRKQAAKSLGEIGTGNEKAINAFVRLLQSTNVHDNVRHQAQDNLIKILQDNEDRFKVVQDLRGYNCYSVLWECAQNMPYPNFYQAWHNSKQEQRRLTLFLLSFGLAPALGFWLGMNLPTLERIFNGSNHKFIPHLCNTNERDKHLCDGVISSPNK